MPATVNRNVQFTKGEKCLFYHIVTTYVLILILIIVYFIHLLVVKHSATDALIARRRGAELDIVPVGYEYLGHVVLNATQVRTVCNCVLLSALWSLAPGHCVAMRSDPDLADILPYWNILFHTRDAGNIITGIKRSIPHPHFNRDDFQNNVGLFEHEISVNTIPFSFSHKMQINHYYEGPLTLIGRKPIINVKDEGSLRNKTVSSFLTKDLCNAFVSPVVAPREYEFCASTEVDSICLDHGALLCMDTQVLGMFTWSEKCGAEISNNNYTHVITDFSVFQDWIEDLSIDTLIVI